MAFPSPEYYTGSLVFSSMKNLSFSAFYSETLDTDQNVIPEDFLKRNYAWEREFQKQLCRVAEENGKLDVLVDFISQNTNVENLDEVLATYTSYKGKGQGETNDSNLNQRDPPSASVETSSAQKTESVRLFDTDLFWLQIPFIAVQQNSLQVLKLCFKTKMNMNNFRWVDGSTLLMDSFKISPQANEEMITFLTTRIDVNLVSNNGKNALSIVLSNDNLSIDQKLKYMRTLISQGACLSTPAPSVLPVLHAYISRLLVLDDAADPCHWKVLVDELMEANLDINERDWFGQTALMVAISIMPPFDYADEFENPEERDRQSNIRKNKLYLIEYLLERGADPNIQDLAGRSCAHLAVATQSIDVVEIILKHKCNPNCLTLKKMTPIYFLCCEADWSDLESVDTTLLPILQRLVQAGCDVNIKGADHSSVLHFAAATMDGSVCRMLVNSGAVMEARDYLRRTPLHFSVRNKSTNAAEMLISLGANVNAVDVHNDTPLHAACLLENLPVAKVLVESGANVSSIGDLGIRPAHLAAENGDREMIEFFGSITDLHVGDTWNALPIHYASSDGNIETTEYLIGMVKSHETNVNHGPTPLELAVYRGQYKLATMLSTDGADIRFGQLPVNLFPNRPLVEINEIDNYFKTVVSSFTDMGKFGPDLGHAILDSTGLGRVSLDDGENKMISDIIEDYVERIAQRIGEMEPTFRCKLLHAGSTAEKVKIGYPDEFDFVCDIECFSSYVERIESDQVPGFASVMMKDDAPEEIKKFCIRSSHSLNAMLILRNFARLVRLASFEVLNEGIRNIYAGNMLLRETGPVFDDNPIPLTRLNVQTVTFRGRKHKFLDISVDLNPVVHVSKIPDNFITDCLTVPDMSKMGIYLIPKYCQQILSLPSQTVPMQSDVWRFSTHHFETAFMKSLPQIARDCYMLCKALRMEPLTCSVDLEQSTRHFQAAENEQLMAEKEENASKDEHTDEDDDSTEDEKTESDGPENIVLDMNSTEDDAEDEITAEKVIPSYYLKTIFIKEVEELTKEGKDFTNQSMCTIPRRVYSKLQNAIKSEELTTLFLPSHNIYHRVQRSAEDKAKMKIQDIYCQNILKLMDALDFKE